MRGDIAMIHMSLAIVVLCGFVQGSIEHGAGVFPVFPGPAQAVAVPPPVVAASSSQYFERTFNRLVAPAYPVAPVQPVIPFAQAPPQVFIQPNAVPVAPASPTEPTQPNIAIAVATAHAAAPVATILLPPYPFGLPPSFGFIPPSPPINVPDESRKEATTQRTTQVEVRTTTPLPISPSPPQPSNSDNNFVQALPSNENVNFKYYGPPQPEFPQLKPQKLKTSVEIVPVPLAYITPPPLPKFQPIKTVKHIHTFVPARAKVIIRPLHTVTPIKIRTVRVPARLVYRAPLISRVSRPINRPESRDIEPTTFRPSSRPFTKPPRI